jgi:hypothetical protein
MHEAQEPTHPPVLVAGAGIAGLTAALAAFLVIAALPARATAAGVVHLICSEAGGTATVRYSSNWDFPVERKVFVRLVDADRCVLGRATPSLPLSDGAAVAVSLAGLHRAGRCAARTPLTFTASLGDPADPAAARGAATCRLVLPRLPRG